MKRQSADCFKNIKAWSLVLAVWIMVFLIGVSDYALAGTGTIEGSVVNVRSGPGSNYPVAGNLYKDSEVTVLEQGDGWYKIEKNQLTGWISSSLIKINNMEVFVRVKQDIANLRSGPGTNYSKAGQAVKGDILTLLDIQGEWYQIKTGNGTKAYIASFLVETFDNTVASSNAAIQNKRVQVNNGPVNLRKGAGTDYEKAGTAQDKETLTVIAQEGDWYKVRLANGSEAFIASWLVNEVNVSTAANPAETGLKPPDVFLDNKQLTFEVYPIIDEGRTLVPLRAIFEAMEAAVSWDNDTRTVLASKGDIKVVLPIGSTKPTVNGTVWEIEVPARIVQDRTLAPLRFVGEAFGCQVEWNGDTRTIYIASAGGSNSPSVAAVKISGEVNLRTGPGTTYDRAGIASAGERLEVLQEADGWYQVSRSGTVAWVAGWVVDPCEEDDNEGTGEDAPESDTTEEEQPSAEDDNSGLSGNKPYIFDINALNIKGNEDAAVEDGLLAMSTKLTPEGYRLVMKTRDKAEPEITVSKDGKKILYTFKGVKVKSNRDEAYLYLGTGKNGRIFVDATSVDDTTWVSIQRPFNYDYRTTSEEEGTKQVFQIPSQIKDIYEMTLNNGNHIITIKSYGSMNINEHRDEDILYIRLSDTSKGTARNEYELEGAGASSIKLSESPHKTEVELQVMLKDIVSYQTTKNINGDSFSIILVPVKPVIIKPNTPQQNPEHSQVTVVLDPGHGGKDPGAIGYSRTLYEKDVNLKIAGKVRDLLEKEDLNVVLTRSTDVYLELNEISEIANRANADLFVSIHCNAHTLSDKCGTETYYYAPEDSPALAAQELQRSLLADMLQKKMVEKMGRTNRGVKQANYAVLRGTKMPSVLVETAFISNPEEESLLKQDYFQQKAAEAISEAIINYLKIMIQK